MTAARFNVFSRMAFLALVCFVARAEINLPPQFSDGMILQRGAKNRIWGGRAPNETVWYEYYPGDGKKIVERASARGKEMWEFSIDVADSMGRTGNDVTIVIWEGKKGVPAPNARTI